MKGLFIFAILLFLNLENSFSRGFSHLENPKTRITKNRLEIPSETSHISKNTAKKREYKNSQINNHNQYQGYYKIGNPYEIQGIIYKPQEYDYYEEVGEASWYGSDFHGKLTANGEIYNMNDFTAAHRTLPLPSVVKVTNLANGKNIVVKVNDRGPFAHDRIIDLSKKAADHLGFQNKGLTNVKLELLKEETEDLLSKLNLK